MKRILREMFRKDQHNLPSLDIIIRAQKLFGPSQFKLVELEFNELVARLQRQTHQRITPIPS